MLNLVSENDDILHTCLNPIDFSEVNKVYLDGVAEGMLSFMYNNGGIGLAANQVGLDLRMFVMSYRNENGVTKEFVCINPEILNQSEEIEKNSEGCLSFPNLRLDIPRFLEVDVRFYDGAGNPTFKTFDGTLSRCFQHELDHLNGVTFDTKVSKLKLNMAKRKRTKFEK